MVSSDKKAQMVAETKMLVELFLENNASDIDLAKMTGISSSTVGRRLTNREIIGLAFPNGEEIFNKVAALRKNNLHMAKIIGGQTSMHSRTYLKDEQGKFQGSSRLRLDIFYPDREQQIKLLMHIALTFRAKLPLLEELFNINEKELLKLLMSNCGSAYNSLLYLFYHDYSNQDLVKENILTFYRDYLDAKRRKNIPEINEVVRRVTDYEASKILKTRKPGEQLTEDIIGVILNYQLKYALTISETVSIFRITDSAYRRGIKNYLETHPDLKKRYEYLVDYNYSKVGRKSSGRRK